MADRPAIVAKVTPKRHRRKNKLKAEARRRAKEQREREDEETEEEDEKVVIQTSVDLAKKKKEEGTITIELRQILDSDSDWDSDDDSYVYYGEESKGVGFDDYDDDDTTSEVKIPELARAQTAQGDVDGQEGLPPPPTKPAWLLDLDPDDVNGLTEIIKERAFGLAASQIIDDDNKDDDLSFVSIASKYGLSEEKVEELAAWLATGENDEEKARDEIMREEGGGEGKKEEEETKEVDVMESIMKSLGDSRLKMEVMEESLNKAGLEGEEKKEGEKDVEDAAPGSQEPNSTTAELPLDPSVAPSAVDEDDESDYGIEGFGYKAIIQAQVPIPKNYMELQMAFADAFPWHDASLVCERANGKSIGPMETKFARDELIVFREYMPEIRKEKQYKKVKKLGGAWEEVEYEPGLKKFQLRSWQLY